MLDPGATWARMAMCSATPSHGKAQWSSSSLSQLVGRCSVAHSVTNNSFILLSCTCCNGWCENALPVRLRV
jgi:hypothetical protein